MQFMDVKFGETLAIENYGITFTPLDSKECGVRVCCKICESSGYCVEYTDGNSKADWVFPGSSGELIFSKMARISIQKVPVAEDSDI